MEGLDIANLFYRGYSKEYLANIVRHDAQKANQKLTKKQAMLQVEQEIYNDYMKYIQSQKKREWCDRRREDGD